MRKSTRRKRLPETLPSLTKDSAVKRRDLTENNGKIRYLRNDRKEIK